MRLTKPTISPQDFGMTDKDSHLVFCAVAKTCKAFDHLGNLLWTKPALLDGQHPNWRQPRGDTPPGLYKLGEVYDDYGNYLHIPSYPPDTTTHRAYGWITFDMIDKEGNEDNNGRAGICIHGGGSALGWPGAWHRYQRLVPTHGCIRMHNWDLYTDVYDLYKKGTVWCSVYQDEQ